MSTEELPSGISSADRSSSFVPSENSRPSWREGWRYKCPECGKGSHVYRAIETVLAIRNEHLMEQHGAPRPAIPRSAVPNRGVIRAQTLRSSRTAWNHAVPR